MLSDQVKELESEVEVLKEEKRCLELRIKTLQKQLEGFENCCKMIIPNKVYTHKERRNTTVKFLDGSQVTVRRRYNEKDCIETAIAYCILKQLIPAADLKKLIEQREGH